MNRPTPDQALGVIPLVTVGPLLGVCYPFCQLSAGDDR